MSNPSSNKQHIKVVVRVRPKKGEEEPWVTVIDDKTIQTINHRNLNENLQYEFETVYGPDTTQMSLYNGSVKGLIHHVLKGQNSSVLAYGPTGAGKTHTILGPANDAGVIPRTVRGLFNLVRVEEKKPDNKWDYKISYSYLEIYNEKVHDLLNPSATDLPVREGQNKNIFVAGLTEQSISDVHQFNETFGPASNNRTTAATKLNERSSRSHSILLLKVSKRHTEPPHRTQTGKLYIIDLAGSEDNRRTGNQGVRLKESGAINTSLLTLGQVVDALNKQQLVIPYRSSKLTRLLQDSLGGNAHSCMIVNLAPEEQYYFDTYTTLNFARKSKKIVNVVRTNETVEKPAVTSTVTSSGIKPKISRPSSIQGRPSTIQGGPSSTHGGLKRKNTISPHNNKATPLKKHKPDPAPFLSPLLRNQEKFKLDLRREMFSRLEQLEERIISSMKSNQPESGHVEPDSTTPDSTMDLIHSSTEDSGVNSSTDSSEKVVKNTRKSIHNLDSLLSEVECFKKVMGSDDTRNKENSENVENKPAEKRKSVEKKRKSLAKTRKSPRGKVFKDGSREMDTLALDSPLFMQPSFIKKKKGVKRSTAAKPLKAVELNMNTESEETQPPPQPTQVQNPEVQKAHNERILGILNSGSMKELQTDLQTVGAKRAKAIFDYRLLNGPYSEFDDLTSIHGLTAKFVDTFKKANLVH